MRYRWLVLGLAAVALLASRAHLVRAEDAIAESARAEEAFRFDAARFEKGELRYIDGIPVILLQGSPEEIGRQHGTLAAKAVAPFTALPKEILKEHGVEGAWPLVAAASRTLVKRVSEDHQREMATMIETSGIDRDMITVGNTMLELRRLGGCSALVAIGGRSATAGPLFGRNLDFPTHGVLHKFGLVLIVRPDGKHAFVSVGMPGAVGVSSGMNDSGLSVAALDVYESADESSMFDAEGVPLMFCYRRLLEECASVDEAEKLMRTLKPTTWANLVVCDAKEAAVFELTPKSLVVRRPDDGLLACTNHFRTKELACSMECWRYDRLDLARKAKRFDVAAVHDYMHAVNQGEWTTQTMVFEPAALKLHVAMGRGPATALPLKTLDMEELFRTGRFDDAKAQSK
jgi:hypothetical protein